MVTWNELVEEATKRFLAAEIPDPEASARWIGQEATGHDGAEWLDLGRRPATERQLAAFDQMVERRLRGEPLQYVLGSWGFRSLDLFVDRRVLIPRPETEVVAKHASDELSRLLTPDGAGRPAMATTDLVVVDLGTGSGAIGLSLAMDHPGIGLWLTDFSADALAVARANLAGIGRAGATVRIAEGSWFEALPAELAGRVGLVVSNPPYVASETDLEPQVARWEPKLALMAGRDGLAHLIHLVDESPGWLTADGALVIEMAPDQIETMAERAEARFEQVQTVLDLAGRGRAIVARYPRGRR
jgi:release factor glutamine methyltransferase